MSPPQPPMFRPASFTHARLAAALLLVGLAALPLSAAEYEGTIVDADTGEPLPARVYLRSAAGEWLFVQSASPAGEALPYQEQWVPMPQSEERHTTVSAHPFRVELAPGEYQLEIERGKEYRPLRRTLQIGDRGLRETLKLQRWSDAAARGWFSGETHVHRRIHELPNVMRAEDLNVAFPVTFWTVRSDLAPDLAPSPLRRQGPSPFGPREDRGVEPIVVDRDRVIVPRNTEYEIFSIGERRHTLGALFVLNHRSVFTATAPPIGAIAEQAHREGALLDLDKHSWPWAMMLVPIARVDLFELSNNSVWRTRFGFSQLPHPLPSWMEVEQDSPSTVTEWGWIQYGLENWYALLNCGFRLSPTAGTASGVHPVPLGHSRVYVHTGESFELAQWLDGLRRGRSFVTTGPMLFATIDGKLPGESFRWDRAGRDVELVVESLSDRPVSRIEVLRNGRVVDSIEPSGERTEAGAHRTLARRTLRIDEPSWVAVRTIEPQDDGRCRFAHTAPWHFSSEDTPIAPRREQVEYLVGLVEQELERNRDVLAPEALREFEQARDIYRELLQRSRR